MEESKIPWVGAQTLSWFYDWCRDHGIPGDNYKLKALLIQGAFAPAAIAAPSLLRDGEYDFLILPSRLEKWAEENAVDYR